MNKTSTKQPAGPVLDIRDLVVELPGPDGERLRALDGVDLTVRRGEIVGLAGESGSGKTMTALALLGLLPHGGSATGRMLVDGDDVLEMTPRQVRDLRGNRVAMVFQDPMTSLHPMLTIGKQLTEHLRHHKKLDKRAANARAVELLATVRIPDPETALGRYPHQFSGGMRQRIAIAIALACDPALLLADEPTTALDVTVQAGILRLLDRLRRENDLSVLIITHDLGVMSALADRVCVMYAGRIVESGPRADVLRAPRHPYTRGLLDALPHPGGGTAALLPIPGSPPKLGQAPAGCAFHPRCPHAEQSCREDTPTLLSLTPTHAGACPIDPLAVAVPEVSAP
ncbi:ABC transporter ATP-binding protein [Embleya sp. NBC_00896]|uniref:ABC transporter ATP-binding protein n=1 Tax=Embleya sp. NBC_00896 TaxID=2975961 RepID=UPI002F90DE1B|nr:ABC transporter ATP-binding protein [Embleya sp. NBC_00896]